VTANVPSIRIARAAAAAARGVPGVVDLSAGTVGEFATYGEGGREPGVKVSRNAATRVTLRLVVEFGLDLPQLAQDVRDTVTAVVAPLTGDAPSVVDLEIVDVRTPSQEPPAAIPATTAPAHDAAAPPPAAPSVRPGDVAPSASSDPVASTQEQPWRS